MNALKDEISPYLLQHADNPVDWYPWCGEAFEKAKRENKPIFLSIGYSTCHWCHVMAQESFSDPEVAEVLNRSFVSVKVDKEERPDIDLVYMAVCQAFTGQGGWPATIFLTPSGKPFFAGTYFPKHQQKNSPGLLELLAAAKEAWNSNPARLAETGDQVIHLLERSQKKEKLPAGEWRKKGAAAVLRAADYFKNSFDRQFGGFGDAPKFPAPHDLLFLLALHEQKRPFDADRQMVQADREIAVRRAARPEWELCESGRPFFWNSEELDMVETTLQHMYAGGIFDHVGGGFCRYSTDRFWLAPHFEKMLYDNALLLMAYTQCFQYTGKPFYRKAAEETAEYVLREMRSPEGGFYSAQDADCEGREGAYYLWTPEEVCSVLGEEDGAWFCRVYGILEGGNFEGESIPNLIDLLSDLPGEFRGLECEDEFTAQPDAEEREKRQGVAEMKRKLLQYRAARMELSTDDKILTGWNSLMIAAFAKAYGVFGKKEYLSAAEAAENFVHSRLTAADGRLFVRFRCGTSDGLGFLTDYAFYEWALLELFAANHRASLLQRAAEVQDVILREFVDEESGGFYFTGESQEQLIFRPKEGYDGALPSGNSAAAYAMLLLYQKLGGEKRKKELLEQLAFTAASAEEHSASHAFGLAALLEADRMFGSERPPAEEERSAAAAVHEPGRS